MLTQQEDPFEINVLEIIRKFRANLGQARTAILTTCVLLRSKRTMEKIVDFEDFYDESPLNVRRMLGGIPVEEAHEDIRSCRRIMHVCRQGIAVFEETLSTLPSKRIEDLESEYHDSLRADGLWCRGCDTVYRTKLSSDWFAMEAMGGDLVAGLQSVCPRCQCELLEGTIDHKGQWNPL